jgi:hypothetical protein
MPYAQVGATGIEEERRVCKDTNHLKLAQNKIHWVGFYDDSDKSLDCATGSFLA